MIQTNFKSSGKRCIFLRSAISTQNMQALQNFSLGWMVKKSGERRTWHPKHLPSCFKPLGPAIKFRPRYEVEHVESDGQATITRVGELKRLKLLLPLKTAKGLANLVQDFDGSACAAGSSMLYAYPTQLRQIRILDLCLNLNSKVHLNFTIL